MSTNQIHVFISHSWSYSNHYDTLNSWIFHERHSVGWASLSFQNFSVPKDDPIHDAASDQALEKAIFNKILHSHVVIIPTGMYVDYSKWIKKEIEGSKKFSTPILGVNPWGQIRNSSVVRKNAKLVVRWNKNSVIDGIWNVLNEQ